MRPVIQTRQLDAADADGIAIEQAIAAGGNLIINGAFASAGVATLDTQRRVLITSSLNLSGETFTVTGTDEQGRVISESLAGPNASTVSTVLDFFTVTEIASLSAFGVFAFSSLTMITAVPTAGETVTLGAQTYTWAAVPSAPDEVDIGGTIDASRDNLVNAIINGPGEGTAYGTGTVANASATAVAGSTGVLVATAISPVASIGNAVVTTETAANASWTSTTMAGGDGVDFGTNGVGGSIPIPCDQYLTPFQLTLDAVITGTVDGTVQFTIDDIWTGVGPFTWQDHSGMTNFVANDTDSLIAPVSAVRLLTNSGVGTIVFTIAQAGIQ